MKMTITAYSHQNIGISIIRMLATVLIVICHILQAYGNVLAFYFNIGVPLFLCISGWLYGNTEKREILTFLSGRFKRVIVPYYLFVFFLLILYLIIKVPFSLKQVASMLLCQQAFGTTIPLCGHLWFITIISVCYIMTPLLLDIRNSYFERKDYLHFIVFFCAMALFVVSISLVDVFPRYIMYVAAYILGFCLAALKECDHLEATIKYKIIRGGVLFICYRYYVFCNTVCSTNKRI